MPKSLIVLLSYRTCEFFHFFRSTLVGDFGSQTLPQAMISSGGILSRFVYGCFFVLNDCRSVLVSIVVYLLSECGIVGMASLLASPVPDIKSPGPDLRDPQSGRIHPPNTILAAVV